MSPKTKEKYDRLNRVLENFISGSSFDDENFFYEDEDFNFELMLAQLIMDIKSPLCNSRYHGRMRLQQSLNHSLAFLGTLKKDYADALSFAVDTGKVYLVSQKLYPNAESLVTVTDGEKRIYLATTDTIEDAYTITHEAMHYINFDEAAASENWHLMTEAFSIVAETLERKYFANLPVRPQDYQINEKNVLYALKVKAVKLDFLIRLILSYNRHRYINQYRLMELLQDQNEFYVYYATMEAREIMHNGRLNYGVLLRYVIGGCLSSYMLDRIDTNSKYLDEFRYLNDHAKEMSFIDTLTYLGLDVLEEYPIVLSNQSLKDIKGAYVKRVKNISQ